jgi:hypothetical protein
LAIAVQVQVTPFASICGRVKYLVCKIAEISVR